MDLADSRYLNLLFNIVDGETKLWRDSVLLDPASSMIKCYLKKKEKDQNQVQRLLVLVSTFGIKAVAIWISRIQISLLSFLKKH